MLTLYAEEEKNPWGASPDRPAAAVVDLFEENPFGPFEEMFFEQTLAWEPYDRRKLLDYLANDPRAGIDVRASRPLYFEGSISRHPTANGITFRVNPGYVSPPERLAQALQHLGRWQTVFPNFTRAGATADRRPAEHFLNQGLRPLPACFGSYLGWYTLISPRGYAPYFDPQDLLAAPAHRVEDLPDGGIAVTAYPDPFDFEGPEATRRIAEITTYLNERRKL